MITPTEAVTGFLILLGLGSATVLAAVFLRWHRNLPLLEPAGHPVPRPHPVALMTSLLWVLPGLAWFVAEPYVKSAAVPADGFSGLPGICLLNALLIAILIIPMLGQPAAEHGLHMDGWKRQIGLGIYGFLASVLPVALVLAATYSMRTPEQQHGLLKLLQEQGWDVLGLIVLSAVILGPLCGELIYRVILQSWLERIAHPREAMLVMSVVFCLVHRLPDAIPLLPLAVILGYLYQQRRGFVAIVTTHALFNATNLVLALSGL